MWPAIPLARLCESRRFARMSGVDSVLLAKFEALGPRTGGGGLPAFFERFNLAMYHSFHLAIWTDSNHTERSVSTLHLQTNSHPAQPAPPLQTAAPVDPPSSA